MDFTQLYTKHSLSEVAVLYIKNKILSGEFKSGDKLIESDISTDLSISRVPVREAMRELNMQGMIVFSPRKGNFVLDMSLDEILEAFDIRIALEVQVLELLVRKNLLTDKDFAHLCGLVENMREQSQKNLEQHEKTYQLNFLDLEFHRYLWKASKSFQRGKILEGLFFQLLIAMNRDLVTLGTFQEKAQEHERIIRALQKNELELVIAEFQAHIGGYIQALTQDFTMKPQP